ncbi:hypothetical protein CC1G_09125 [Coprinopsis cinerea okayama7|uniref:Uncharacterized protein n=1 Tax=Coprinopsis cinerea (strain Okayama-7 / 130 / ATCC MYA-4618 / FGSC 9003) TaxID=240176 RepID=A8NJ84_COPC7|nr:hypothetical protein CC1G_09125 [Coprinopsis cinerea okayama7\|eukprot:XP_001834168.2 hypothetical protein CC1G_09125 [Coprinopsis cinerea okayama7\
MHGQNDLEATPNPRAIPSSAVKNVEESRQQRLQRQQSRFRDRGGIFVPTSRNTLADILLGRRDASPKKPRRSRGRSVSVSPRKPYHPPSSPSVGKSKKKASLSTSNSLRKGIISTALRRSPRKQKAAVQFDSELSEEEEIIQKAKSKAKKAPKSKASTTASKKGKAKAPAESSEDEKVDNGKCALLTSSSKQKAASKSKQPTKSKPKPVVDPVENDIEQELEQPPSKTAASSRGKATKPTKKGKGRGKAILSEIEDEPDELPPVKKSTSKARPRMGDSEDEDDLQPLTSKAKAKKRKLSIVEEEEEEQGDLFIAQSRARAPSPSDSDDDKPLSSPAPKRPKVSSTTQASSSTVAQKPASAHTKPLSAAKREQPTPTSPVFPPKANAGKRKLDATSKVVDVPDSKAKKPKTGKTTNSRPTPLPLQEIHPSENDSDTEIIPLHKKPTKSKPPNKKAESKRSSKSKQKKENTPISDVADYIIPVKSESNKGTGKRKKAITGPRKSAVVRIQQPIPPIEDNDPDPIDFLS